MEGRILSRREVPLSLWVTVIEKEVQFGCDEPSQTYHCLAQADYVAILAETPDGRFPIVRQYRPAVEAYTLELPAGLLETGENPEQACCRELREETGLEAKTVFCLGTYYADTGRLENRQHVFYVQASAVDPNFSPESGMSVEYLRLTDIEDLIARGEFRHQLHIAVLLLYQLHRTGRELTAPSS